jgi:hypothetical protein
MQINFWLLKKIVRALIVPSSVQEKKGRRRAGLLFFGKIVFSLLLLGGLLFQYPVQAWSFMGGVSLLLLTCMIVTLLESPTGPQIEENNV